MVRLGIGLYGLGIYHGMEPLEEVVQWKCRISQVGELLSGESVGIAELCSGSYQALCDPSGGVCRWALTSLSGGKGQVIVNAKHVPFSVMCAWIW